MSVSVRIGRFGGGGNGTDTPYSQADTDNLIVTIFVINGVFIGICLVGLMLLRWMQLKELIRLPPPTDGERRQGRRAAGSTQERSSTLPKKGRNDTMDSNDPEEVLQPNGQPIDMHVLEVDQAAESPLGDQFRFEVVNRDESTDRLARQQKQVAQS